MKKDTKIHKVIINHRFNGSNENNNLQRGNYYKANKKKKDEQSIAGWYMRKYLGNKKFKSIKIKYIWYEPNKRRDKDNIVSAVKVLHDALQIGRYIENDGWKEIVSWENNFGVDKDNPRVEMIIEEC